MSDKIILENLSDRELLLLAVQNLNSQSGDIHKIKKTVYGNGLGWGIKNQVRVLWAVFLGGLTIFYKGLGK